MRAKLVNQFAWSSSRSRIFSECKRRYYLRYYRQWGGWERDASPESRLAYRLTKMISMPQLAGQAVHEVLSRHFHALRMGEYRPLQPERPVERMRSAFRAARAESWRANPKKNPPLFELYYKKELSPSRLRELAEGARRAIRHLQEMPLYHGLRSLPGTDLAWIDPLPGTFSPESYFDIRKFQVIAIPDLVIRRGDELLIFDWKTGRPRPSDRRQMEVYALWARQHLEGGEGKIRACLVYLASSEADEFTVSPAAARRAAQFIRVEMEAMSAYLKDAGKNIPLDRDSFPMDNNTELCWGCFFQEICFPGGTAALEEYD
jgi:hypothetical protein